MSVTRRQFAPAAASLAALAASPAFGQQTNENVKWRLTSSFPKSLDTLYGAAQTICRVTGEMTDGKFELRPFSAGEIVPSLQVLDAVANGTVECGQTYTGYYIGKNPSLIFDGSVPFGLTARMHNAWMMFGDGQKLMTEIYDSFNVVALPCGQTGGQMFGWFRKELKTPADFSGLKIRTAGFGGKVMAKLGAVPQQIAAGDIYPALERGTIDACEWVGPYDDEKLGFNKVAKYYYTPGVMELEAVNQLFIGKAGCVSCHSTPQFSDDDFHVIGLHIDTTRSPHADPQEPGQSFNQALICDSTVAGGNFSVRGHFSDDTSVSRDPGFCTRPISPGRWRTKALRQVAGTAPYFRDGQAATLDEVIEFYDRGGDAAGTFLGGASELHPLHLSRDEKRFLKQFLESLTGDPVPAAQLVDLRRH